MEVWETCKVTNKTFNSARGFLNHLRTLNISSKEYYDKFYRKNDEGMCYCGNPTKYHGFSYKEYCSSKCFSRSEKHRKCVSERFIKNPQALVNFREKKKSLNIDYKSSIDKRKQTISNKCKDLGISESEYYSQHSKNAFKSMSSEKLIQRTLKAMKTKEENGTLECKSGYKKYPFFDEFVSLQGYEPIVLNSLIEDFNLGKNEIMIGKSNIPIIKYGNNKLYFPDFYLPKQNLLIEVKSTYTFEKHKENVFEKCNASIKQGYSIALVILKRSEARNRKLDGSKNLLHWAISSQAPNPNWYGEGSTTISFESRDKCSEKQVNLK
jgi:hypothetical protein